MRNIFGIGSGRCGTMSISKLLSKCPKVKVKHELMPRLPWKKDLQKLSDKIRRVKKIDAPIRGDIAYYNLNYVKELLELKNTKIVAIKRNKKETVKSYMRKTSNRNRNHWSPKGIEDSIWDKTYPTFNKDKDKEKAIEKYWDIYYRKVDQLLQKYPKKLSLFNMKSTLNTESGQDRLFNFLQIDNNHKHEIPCQYNSFQ